MSNHTMGGGTPASHVDTLRAQRYRETGNPDRIFPPVPEVKQPRDERSRRIGLVAGAVALLVGAIGPWASVLGAIHAGPTANAETSIVVFGGVVLLVLAGGFGRWTRGVSIVVGFLALAESIYTLVKIEQYKSSIGEWGSLVSPGWGLYFTIIGGAFLVVSTWLVPKVAQAR